VSPPAKQQCATTAVHRMVLEMTVGRGAAVLRADVPRALTRVFAICDEVVGPLRGRVGVLVENDCELHRLNHTWRGIDRPTNVLSFPSPWLRPDGRKYLGDIAISYESVVREARALNKPPVHHLAHLAVHGLLHLLGHDHDSEETAGRMEHLERTILARLGAPDPYAVCA
jgi:probable rRNA maturation factor